MRRLLWLAVLLLTAFSAHVRTNSAPEPFVSRAWLSDANEGLAETGVTYISLHLPDDKKDRSFGIVISGDADLVLMKWLAAAEQRGAILRLTFEDLDK